MEEQQPGSNRGHGARPLAIVWLALLALLALSAGSAWLRLGWINGAINLGIALAKALLVMVVFMRLRRAHSLVRVTAAIGVCTLLLLFTLAGADYATRTQVRAPWQEPATVPAATPGPDPRVRART